MTTFSTILIVVLLTPLWVFVVECLLATCTIKSGAARSTQDRTASPVAILIPAHNEESGLRETLESVAPQLRSQDRILVVADNCTDQTASIARAAGAVVVERTDPDRRGKGFALDTGLRAMEDRPPEIVVIIDADCRINLGTIAALANQVEATGRPAQAVYLMDPPLSPITGNLISAFAFRIKNMVRPLGLSRIGLPCLLTGSGMAFTWKQLRDASLANGNIVEDMQLGLDFTINGASPLLCRDAVVTSRLPGQARAAESQRRRWEHGHLRTIRTQVPRLMTAFIKRPRLATLAVAAELSVPPLSLLAGMLFGLTLLSSVLFAIAHHVAPLAVCIAAWLALSVTILLVRVRFGRDLLCVGALLSIPRYALRKAGLYWDAVRRPEQNWVRTDRHEGGASALHHLRPGSLDSRRIPIGHARIDNLSMDEAIQTIETLIRARTPSFVVTPNVDHIVKLETQHGFRAAYDNARLVLADGMPLLWAARWLRTPLKAKVSGSDLFPRFCQIAGQRGYRIFLLGGRPGAADETAARLRSRYPNLQIATCCPPFGFEQDPELHAKIIQEVKDFAPDVLFVGLGAPKQELWMHQHSVKTGVPVSIGVGGSFEFAAGYVRRAPRLMQRTGLEWLWRLLAEPRRMYRRYLIEDPAFVGIIWRQLRTNASS